MFLAGLGTATPPNRYTQQECWEALRNSPLFGRLKPRSQAICRKVFNGANGIETRHLALNRLEDAYDLSPSAQSARFAGHAPATAAAAARRALDDAAISPGEIDAVLVSTCTGYLCPGLTSYLSETLGLRHDAQLLDLVGQGCGAALPNLRTAQALLAAGGCRQVLSVCVEICSAALYLDDDPGVLISACLFGDGAGATVLSTECRPGQRRVRWAGGTSTLSVAERDCLRFESRDGMLRNILAPHVPAVAARYAEEVLRDGLAQRGLRREEIRGWILHAGGRDVLVAVRERLGLSEEDTALTSEMLRRYGNLSSPFVLFVLEAALRRGLPGGWWWMASFGAGFSSHGALWEVE